MRYSFIRSIFVDVKRSRCHPLRSHTRRKIIIGLNIQLCSCVAGLILAQTGGLSASEIEAPAVADLQNRAARNSDTIDVKSIELERTWLGKTPTFRFCNSLDRVFLFSKMYIWGEETYNLCNPVSPVWKVQAAVKWGQQAIPTTQVYMVFTTSGKLVEASADNIP